MCSSKRQNTAGSHEVAELPQPSCSFMLCRIRPPYVKNDWEHLLPTPRAIQAYTVQKETKNEREKGYKVRTQSTTLVSVRDLMQQISPN